MTKAAKNQMQRVIERARTITATNGKKCQFVTTSADDVALAFRDDLQKPASQRCKHFSQSDPDFYGQTSEAASQSALTGDMSLVPESDALLSMIESEIDFPTARRQNVATVAGGAVNVPAYLSGRPNCMIQRRDTMSDVGAVKIGLNMFISAQTSQKVIRRRGAAAMALIRALSAVRPVTLSAVHAYRHDPDGKGSKVDSITVIDLDTSPLDLARAAWFLSAPAATRRLGFSLCYAHAKTFSDTGIPPIFGLYNHKEGTRVVAETVATQTDVSDFLLVPSIHGNDETAAHFKTDAAAAAWVQTTLQRYTTDTLAA